MFPFSQWRRKPLQIHHERREGSGGGRRASEPVLVEAQFGVEDAVEARHELGGGRVRSRLWVVVRYLWVQRGPHVRCLREPPWIILLSSRYRSVARSHWLLFLMNSYSSPPALSFARSVRPQAYIPLSSETFSAARSASWRFMPNYAFSSPPAIRTQFDAFGLQCLQTLFIARQLWIMG